MRGALLAVGRPDGRMLSSARAELTLALTLTLSLTLTLTLPLTLTRTLPLTLAPTR